MGADALKESFFRGALILGCGSLASRILGFVYRIYIVRQIGAEGIGLYEMVFPIITFILVLTTAGIPVALAKVIASDLAKNNFKKVRMTVRVAFFLLTFSGILFPAILLHNAPWLFPKICADPRAYWAFKAMIPALFFVSISSVFRGYYQGINFMVPNALGQLIEQVTRVIVGLALVSWLLPYGIEFGAAGLALAVVAGEGVGLFVLLVYYIGHSPKNMADKMETEPQAKIIIQQLLILAAPVTMSRIISSLMLSIKAIMIPNRLQVAGATLEQATQAYGSFSGMAMSLLSFPTVITSSLSMVLLPAIATAIANSEFGQLELRINQGIKLTILIALPFAVWFFLLPDVLTETFFRNSEAGISLKILALGCVFLYLQQATAGMLYGLGEMKTIFINSLVGNSIALIITYSLTGIPALGIRGAAIGLVVGATIICLMNIGTLLRRTPVAIDIGSWAAAACFATIAMGVFIGFMGKKFSLLTVLISSGFFYSLVVFTLGGIKKADFRSR